MISRGCPQNPIGCNELGVRYRSQQRHEEAAACFRQAVQLKPDYAEAHVNLSAALRALGEHAAAAAAAQQALELDPDRPDGLLNFALACHDLGLSAAAAEGFTRLVARTPSNPSAHYNLGAARMHQHRMEEAADHYRRALELKPDYPQALNGLSHALRVLGQWEEAISAGRQALALKPDFPEALGHLAILLQSVCNWNGVDALRPRLEDLTRRQLSAGEETAIQPMLSLWLDCDPRTRLQIAKSHSQEIQKGTAVLRPAFASDPRPRPAGEPLTVGYLSGDFRNHPVAQQILGLLRRHDRAAFRVHGYSYSPDDGSESRKAIEAACDCFIDLRDAGNIAAAERIHRDGVNLLVDLSGHTTGNRMGICAFRPAPVQVSYLGFPGTTGADCFDYFITDPTATPRNQAPFYSEKLVFLPHCYMVTDDTQPIAAEPCRRQDVGLREDQFVFCSFNNFAKIEPVMFRSWMSILRTVPAAVLWLPGGSPMAAAHLRQSAAASGVAPDRLIFAEKLPSKAHHLARLALADVALDTRIYNGHVSTCDALWAGLPVLTLLGNQFAARASASMLMAAGLAELVTGSLAEFEAAAIKLALHPQQLNELRRRLNRSRTEAPLFDTTRFTRNMERAYTAMWNLFRQGEKPRPIEIDEP
jgi:protein O-GlcNAc transferase